MGANSLRSSSPVPHWRMAGASPGGVLDDSELSSAPTLAPMGLEGLWESPRVALGYAVVVGADAGSLTASTHALNWSIKAPWW